MPLLLKRRPRLAVVAAVAAALLLLQLRLLLAPRREATTPAARCEALRLLGTRSGIPPLIHQTWATRAVPDSVSEHVVGWRSLRAPFEHTIWSDADNRRLWAEHWPEAEAAGRRVGT